MQRCSNAAFLSFAHCLPLCALLCSVAQVFGVIDAYDANFQSDLLSPTGSKHPQQRVNDAFPFFWAMLLALRYAYMPFADLQAGGKG